MEIFEKAEEISALILDSDAYRRFIMAKEKLDDNPEIAERVTEYRKKNFALQNGTSNNKIDELRELENEYGEVLKNTLIREFLNAELILCRTIQNINEIIAEKLDFEMDFI